LQVLAADGDCHAVDVARKDARVVKRVGFSPKDSLHSTTAGTQRERQSGSQGKVPRTFPRGRSMRFWRRAGSGSGSIPGIEKEEKKHVG
jgi:hypothetical protein